MISAKVICHSLVPSGEELITVEGEFHRFILAEINTHRVLSRNYQSSRAVPVKSMIAQVRDNPAIPVHWGKNQRGMVAEEELNTGITYLGRDKLITLTPEEAWREAAKEAAFWAERFHRAEYHKQVVNRILEPYIWTKGVITATKEGWESVFKLRCNKDAQPEFQALAYMIKEAIETSVPDKLVYGDWHLPYVKWVRLDSGKQGFIANRQESDETSSRFLKLGDAIKVSSSCCGQVSYRTIDDSLERAKDIYNMLNLPEEGVFGEDPPHFSPAEHTAKCVNPEIFKGANYTPTDVGGNFNTRSFYQYRKMLERGSEGVYI